MPDKSQPSDFAAALKAQADAQRAAAAAAVDQANAQGLKGNAKTDFIVAATEDRIEAGYNRVMAALRRTRVIHIAVKRELKASAFSGFSTNVSVYFTRTNATGEYTTRIYQTSPRWSDRKISDASVLRAKRAMLVLLERAQANAQGLKGNAKTDFIVAATTKAAEDAVKK